MRQLIDVIRIILLLTLLALVPVSFFGKKPDMTNPAPQPAQAHGAQR